MITYRRDYDKSYDLKIKTLLRSYNAKFVENNNYTDCIYLYALSHDQFVGSLTVSFNWDWASISDICYDNRNILHHLVQKAWEYYKDRAVGIKLFTLDLDQLSDFLSVGFKHINTIDFLEDNNYYIADLNYLVEKDLSEYKIIQCFEPIENYQKIVSLQVDLFNKKHKISDLTEVFDMVALDNEEFVGGIQSELYKKSLYINRLVVHEEYRKHAIGTELINKLLEFAVMKEVNFIQLGTCEFQARGFYEKFGFKVVHTRIDNPKGYKNYTMIKYMEPKKLFG